MAPQNYSGFHSNMTPMVQQVGRYVLTPTQQAMIPPKVQRLLQNFGPIVDTPVGRRYQLNPGSIVKFSYSMPGINDPQPMIMIAFDQVDKGLVHGINFHYIPIQQAFNFLFQQGHCNNRGFSYQVIRGMPYIAEAYRSYRWFGMKNIQFEDCEDLKIILNPEFRDLDPYQLEAMKQQMDRMSQQPVNQPMASPTGEQPF